MDGVLTVSYNNTVLADGTQSGGRCTIKSANGRPVTQIAEFFRAVAIMPFGRGNIRNTLSFEIVQTQASTIVALQRFFGEAQNIPNTANWTISWTDDTGTLSAVLLAGFEVDLKFVGPTTIFTYKLTGGVWTVTSSIIPVVDGGSASSTSPDILSDGTGSFTPIDIYDFGNAASV